MPRPAKQPKSIVLECLSRVFQKNGYEGASLKMLADAADLSKASLYHYFPGGKAEMAAAVLARAGSRLQRHIFDPLGATDVETGLVASLKGVGDYYDGEIPICLMNGLTMGTGQVLFGHAIKQTVDAWQGAYEKAYLQIVNERGEAQAWAAYAIERIQGALILCRVSGSRMPLENCLTELQGDVNGL
jgi:TetR/AcrR family transcriptional repressor of lmrAB and yxaGH operons